MKTRIALFLLLSLTFAALVFAHAGEVHSYLGTITKVNAADSFVLKTKDGKQHTIVISKATTITHTDGHAGKASELVVGTRASVKMSTDGKTATSVKLTPGKQGHKK